MHLLLPSGLVLLLLALPTSGSPPPAFLQFAVEQQGRVRQQHAVLLVLRVQKCASTLLEQVFTPAHCTTRNTLTCTTLRRLDEGTCHSVPAAGQARCWRNVYDYSLADALAQGFGGDPLRNHLRRLTRHVRYIDGHFKFGLHRVLSPVLPDHAYTYVTSVREPLKRVVSQFNWWVEQWDLAMTFREWVFNQRTHKGHADFGGYMKSNHMVRVLCGSNESSSNGSRHVLFEEDKTALTAVPSLTTDHLRCAQTHLLRDFSLVLVQEDFDHAGSPVHALLPAVVSAAYGIAPAKASLLADSVHHFKDTSHRPPIKRGAHSEISSGRRAVTTSHVDAADLPEDVGRRLSELNALDQALYHFAKGLSHCQVAHYADAYHVHVPSRRAPGPPVAPWGHLCAKVPGMLM